MTALCTAVQTVRNKDSQGNAQPSPEELLQCGLLSGMLEGEKHGRGKWGCLVAFSWHLTEAKAAHDGKLQRKANAHMEISLLFGQFSCKSKTVLVMQILRIQLLVHFSCKVLTHCHRTMRTMVMMVVVMVIVTMLVIMVTVMMMTVVVAM